uniref:SAP domain-containing protein n=1 Tax=Gadus morhua TaxID=8049 RepID=A0A8C5AN84_GADMO
MADLEDVTLDGRPLNSLRVADLKAALEERGLSKSGPKNALVKRLKGALMLENLQRTSTPHSGLQPNSQIGEEMSQNSFIKQYLAKQQELLRQRLEREAREAGDPEGKACHQSMAHTHTHREKALEQQRVEREKALEQQRMEREKAQEQQRMEKEKAQEREEKERAEREAARERERMEKAELERKRAEEQERVERERAETLQRERALEKEREEKERALKQEREREEKERVLKKEREERALKEQNEREERERALKKEREERALKEEKEREEKERVQKKEREEREERDRVLKKEREEKERVLKKEREEEESALNKKQEEKEREEKKNTLEHERREKEAQEQRDKAKMADRERESHLPPSKRGRDIGLNLLTTPPQISVGAASKVDQPESQAPGGTGPGEHSEPATPLSPQSSVKKFRFLRDTPAQPPAASSGSVAIKRPRTFSDTPPPQGSPITSPTKARPWADKEGPALPPAAPVDGPKPESADRPPVAQEPPKKEAEQDRAPSVPKVAALQGEGEKEKPKRQRKRSSSSDSSSSDSGSSSSGSSSSSSSSRGKSQVSPSQAAAGGSPRFYSGRTASIEVWRWGSHGLYLNGYFLPSPCLRCPPMMLLKLTPPPPLFDLAGSKVSPGPTSADGDGDSGAARKRRWGSSTAVTAKKPSISITTESLKSLIPDMKPGAGQDAVVDLHPEEAVLSGAEEEMEEEEREQPDQDLQIRRTVTQVVPLESQENGQKEAKRSRREETQEKESICSPNISAECFTPPPVTPSGDAPVRRSISQQRSGVTITIDDPVRSARQPSPPRSKVSSIVHVSNLVRPFTLGQLKELLGRTGTLLDTGFWIDKIKSHCYVTYSSPDEAVATRTALHGVKWPQSNPKVLSVEFCQQDELEFHKNLGAGVKPGAEDQASAPGRQWPPSGPPSLLPEREQWAEREREMARREQARTEREWDRDKVREFGPAGEEKAAGPRRSRSRERKRKERGKSKERKNDKKAEKAAEDPPAKLLDDLFQKTKAAPCIYWLPLTEETFALREAANAERAKERERNRKEQDEEEEKKRKEEEQQRKERVKAGSGPPAERAPRGEGDKDRDGERERERDRGRDRGERDGNKRREASRRPGAGGSAGGGGGGGSSGGGGGSSNAGRGRRSHSRSNPRERRR